MVANVSTYVGGMGHHFAKGNGKKIILIF